LAEIAPGKWFAAGKTDLQNAKPGGFTNDAGPFFRRELAIVWRGELLRARF
jgi:hypothetical protein